MKSAYFAEWCYFTVLIIIIGGNRMNIGIISINAHTKVLNFASPIHSYAFQQFLKQNGIDSIIIDYKPNYYGTCNPKYPLLHYRKHKNNDPKKQRELEKKWLKLFLARRKRFNKIQKFIDTYYKTTNKCYSAKILNQEDVEEGIDCYICATDVIWKCNPKAGFDKGFMLACKSMEGKGKIAYAASRGPSKYNEEKEKEFLSYIKDFDHISVRERSFCEYIESISDIPVTHVLDPVLLHDKAFYEPITKHPKKKGYVLIYVVEDNMKRINPLIKLAVAFAKKKGLEVIELSEYLEHRNFPKGTSHKVVYGIGIEEWLGYLHDADYIFTNSFHAACFSVIFEKEFFVGARHGDKIESLLEMFGISNRLTSQCFEKNKFIGTEIDYVTVNEKMKEYQKSSAEYILNAIHDVEKKMQQE